MGKRIKGKKLSSTLTWKAVRGFFRLVTQGIIKGAPLWVLAAIGLALFWGIRENLYADPGFLVQVVQVTPEDALSPEEAAGLERRWLNQNLFKIPIRQISKEIERNPRIQAARVVREFPRTLRIEVYERRPFAGIRFEPRGFYHVLSEDGFVLAREEEKDSNLIQVEAWGPRKAKPQVGQAFSLAGYPEAVAFLKAFWKHPLSRTEKVEAIRLDHLGNVALVLRNGPELRFGRNPLQRLQAFDSVKPLLEGPERQRIIYIDLQYRDLIVRKE